MNNTELQNFIKEVMSIDAGHNGLAGGSAGITGVTSANNDLVLSLRRNAMDFATEYSKEAPDHERVAQSAGQLEGSLRALQMVSDLSEAKLKELLAALDNFVQKIFS